MALPFLEIDSFLPVIDHLSNVICLADKSLHIRGAVSKADLDALLSYIRMVGTFTLTDSSQDLQGRTISPGTYIRLAKLHNLDAPFFPSLKHLRIFGDANSSLTPINLLLSNSLRSIELLDINHTHEEVFSLFLGTLAEECPELSSIKLASPLSTSIWENCLKFSHLRALELKDAFSDLHFDLLVTIGRAFPQLEIMILDARTAKYTGAATSPDLSQLHTDGKDPPQSTSPQSEPMEPPLPPEPLFQCLEKLHITGGLALIQDLVGSVLSPRLMEIALTLVRFKQTFQWYRRYSGATFVPRLEDLETPVFVPCLENVLSTWGHSLANIFISQYEDYPPSGSGLQYPPVFPTLPVAVCQEILALPKLECLNVSGWTMKLKSLLEYPSPRYSTTPNPLVSSSLKYLHFPVESINQGVSLSGLRFIAASFPNLISFQSRIVGLDIPPSKATKIGHSHGLKILSIGNASSNSNPREVLDVARYIFSLFPSLKEIRTHDGHNEDQWDYIYSLVRAFQDVRLDRPAHLN